MLEAPGAEAATNSGLEATLPSVDDSARPGESPSDAWRHEAPVILVACGLPPDTAWWAVGTTAPIAETSGPVILQAISAHAGSHQMEFGLDTRSWAGYTFRFFGVAVGDPQDAVRGTPGHEHVTTLRFPSDDDSSDILVPLQILTMTVAYDGDPLAAEQSWGPIASEPRTRGSGPGLDGAVWERVGHAHTLLAYLYRQVGPGHRGESSADVLDEMAGWMRDYIRRHPGTQPHEVQRNHLAEIGCMTPKSLDNKMTNHKITLKKIRRRLAEF